MKPQSRNQPEDTNPEAVFNGIYIASRCAIEELSRKPSYVGTLRGYKQHNLRQRPNLWPQALSFVRAFRAAL